MRCLWESGSLFFATCRGGTVEIMAEDSQAHDSGLALEVDIASVQ